MISLVNWMKIQYPNLLSYSLWESHSRIMEMTMISFPLTEYNSLQPFGRSYFQRLSTPYFFRYDLGISLF